MNIDSSQFERDVERQLKQLGDDVFREVVKTANEIRTDAIRKTPVDTGALRSAWQMRERKNTRGGTVTVSNETEYAPYIEYGTSRAKAQPMLWPAVERHVRDLRRRIEGLIR